MYAPTLCPMTTNLGLSSVREVNGGEEIIVSIIRALLSICWSSDSGVDNWKSSWPANEIPRIVVLGDSSCKQLKNSS